MTRRFVRWQSRRCVWAVVRSIAWPRSRSLALTLRLGLAGAVCGLLLVQAQTGSVSSARDPGGLARMGSCGNHPCAYFADTPQVLFLQPQGQIADCSFCLPTAVGDFNGDGIPDVAAATSSISVYPGNGNGTFGRAIVTAGSFTPSEIVTGDFNNDGKLDLMMANYAGSLLLLLGNGDGTFQAPTTIAPDAVFLAAGDFNNDGNLDVAFYDGLANVYVFLGNGMGNFSQSAVLPISDGEDLAIGDLTHDGHLDLAVTYGYPGSVSIYLGKGDGTFGPALVTQFSFGAYEVAIHDFNRDGNNDVAVSEGDDIIVLLGNGDGTFQPPITNPSPVLIPQVPGVAGMAIADFNHDGIPDIAVVGFQVDLGYVLLGAGDGTFPTLIPYPLIGSFFSTVIAADLNGDHIPDLVVSGAEVTFNFMLDFASILLGQGDGALRGPPDVSLGVSPQSIAAADFNDDGIPDIVTANLNPSSLSVALGTGDGYFQSPAMVSLSFSPRLVAAGDFNGDGKEDLVVSSTVFGSPTLAILMGDGAGGFRSPVFIPDYFNSVAAIALGDLNNDGKLDIVVPGAVFLGNGDGTFQAPITVPTTIGAQSLALADFNGDGKLDLAAGEGSLHILLGKGNGTFTPKANIPVGNGTSTLVIADFNADGKLDVAIAGGYPGVSVFLGNGDATFQPELVSSSTLAVVDSLLAADFNLDGKLSLAFLSYQNSVSFLAGNGDGTFMEAQIVPVEFSPTGMAEAALNTKNSEPGLVVANSGSNTVSVMTNVTKRR